MKLFAEYLHSVCLFATRLTGKGLSRFPPFTLKFAHLVTQLTNTLPRNVIDVGLPLAIPQVLLFVAFHRFCSTTLFTLLPGTQEGLFFKSRNLASQPTISGLVRTKLAVAQSRRHPIPMASSSLWTPGARRSVSDIDTQLQRLANQLGGNTSGNLAPANSTAAPASTQTGPIKPP